MGLTRYLGWVLLPILVWSLGGAWIEGFTRSQFQRSAAMDSEMPEQNAPLHTIKPVISLPTKIPADIFADANSSARWQYKNSLNSTHYMLYHDQAPPEELRPPFTFGFLTTMARLEGMMRRKKHVTVAIIGGSVTAAYCKEPGIGCWVTPVTEWLLQENPQPVAVSSPWSQELNLVLIVHMNGWDVECEGVAVWQHGLHSLAGCCAQTKIENSAIGGITSSTAAQCFDAMVDPESDLVLIEFSLNDRFIPPQQQIQGFEQLLRRLLKLPHQPAVVVIHWWSPVHDCSDSQQVPNANNLTAGTLPCLQHVWYSTEDHIQRLVQHYNVHSLSFRNSFWSEIDDEAEGFTPDVLFMKDQIHPSGRGVSLLGGLIIDHLQQALRKALAQGFQAKPEENTPVPQPLFVSASDDAKASQCNRGGALQDMVLYNYGWRWLDGKKPGFQTDDILTSLFLSVPTASTTSDKISVGYLSSYQNMGIARISCLGACQCAEFDIDANSKAHASQEHNAMIPFQHAKDSKGCILKVDNMNRTNAANGGHRFKVSSVAVAEHEARGP